MEAVKKAGGEAHLDGHRSLFIGSVVGKAFHRFVRSKIIDRTEGALRGTHYGVRRGSSVTQASHLAVLFESAKADRRHSSAVLFIDARAAYYRVIRQLVYGSDPRDDDGTVIKIMQHFGLSEASWRELLQVIQDGGLLQAHGFSDHARHIAKDLHD